MSVFNNKIVLYLLVLKVMMMENLEFLDKSFQTPTYVLAKKKQ